MVLAGSPQTKSIRLIFVYNRYNKAATSEDFAGGRYKGDTCTVQVVRQYTGQRILAEGSCGGDLSGELLGHQHFSVKYPSPFYDKLRRNPVTTTPGLQRGYSKPRPTEATCRGKFQHQGKNRRGWYPYAADLTTYMRKS